LNEILTGAVKNANVAVQEGVPGAGTTLTMAVIMGNTAYIAHVGDTRAYVFKQNQLKQVTQDHSFSQRLEELGETTAQELALFQNVLYKAIGQTKLADKDIDTYVQHLPPGASLLLCSDGLWGLVADSNIKEVLAAAPTPQHACERLITLANENGGRDNITVIIISMGIETQ
jgi:protein phosphatase